MITEVINVTVKQASELLQMNEKEIYSLVNQRKIPFFRAEGGRKILLPYDSIKEWAKNQAAKNLLEE